MKTSSNLHFFKEVVVRLVMLTAIHFCSDCLVICMQLKENSCSLLKNVIWQICFAKQTLIQKKSLFVQTHSDYLKYCRDVIFLSCARVIVVGVFVVDSRALARTFHSHATPGWARARQKNNIATILQIVTVRFVLFVYVFLRSQFQCLSSERIF